LAAERFFSGGPPWFLVVKVLPTAPTADPEDAWVVPADEGLSLAWWSAPSLLENCRWGSDPLSCCLCPSAFPVPSLWEYYHACCWLVNWGCGVYSSI
jgi:hypothetical protein